MIDTVYPGHPTVIMWHIIQTYASLEEAVQQVPPHNMPHALANPKIRGAGGNVSEAITILEYLRGRDHTISAALEAADTFWAECEWKDTFWLSRWKEGQDQADVLKDALRTKLPKWIRQ